MIIYLIGAITNDDVYKCTFGRAGQTVRKMYPTADIINPAWRNEDLAEDEYKMMSLRAVQACDMVVKTSSFEQSEGARWELAMAKLLGKKIGSLYEFNDEKGKEVEKQGGKQSSSPPSKLAVVNGELVNVEAYDTWVGR